MNFWYMLFGICRLNWPENTTVKKSVNYQNSGMRDTEITMRSNCVTNRAYSWVWPWYKSCQSSGLTWVIDVIGLFF